MSYTDDLINHAVWLLVDQHRGGLDEVAWRRAVSAGYYALFHLLCGQAAAMIAPHVAEDTQHRIQRWFEHVEMKRVCRRFAQAKLDSPLRELIGDTASTDLQIFANNFIKLQEARHSADYDMGYALTLDEANELVRQSIIAMKAWQRIAKTAEANIFVLSLLLWKQWDKERA